MSAFGNDDVGRTSRSVAGDCGRLDQIGAGSRRRKKSRPTERTKAELIRVAGGGEHRQPAKKRGPSRHDSNRYLAKCRDQHPDKFVAMATCVPGFSGGFAGRGVGSFAARGPDLAALRRSAPMRRPTALPATPGRVATSRGATSTIGTIGYSFVASMIAFSYMDILTGVMPSPTTATPAGCGPTRDG